MYFMQTYARDGDENAHLPEKCDRIPLLENDRKEDVENGQ